MLRTRLGAQAKQQQTPSGMKNSAWPLSISRQRSRDSLSVEARAARTSRLGAASAAPRKDAIFNAQLHIRAHNSGKSAKHKTKILWRVLLSYRVLQQNFHRFSRIRILVIAIQSFKCQVLLHRVLSFD